MKHIRLLIQFKSMILYPKSYLVIVLLNIMFFHSSFGQNNICDQTTLQRSEFDSKLCTDIHLLGLAVNIRVNTSNMKVGDAYIFGRKKSPFFQFDESTIGLKASENQSWAFLYAAIYNDNTNLITDSAYIGYSKWEYGQDTLLYLTKVKKTRIYPQNKILTESVTFDNGIKLIIENRVFVRKLILKNGDTIEFDSYSYE